MWTRCFLSDLYGGLYSGELHREMDGGQHVFTDIMERIAKRRVKKNLENFNNLKKSTSTKNSNNVSSSMPFATHT